MDKIKKSDLITLLSWIKGKDSFEVMNGNKSTFEWDYLFFIFNVISKGKNDQLIDVENLKEFEEILIQSCSIYDKLRHIDIKEIDFKNNSIIDDLISKNPDIDMESKLKEEAFELEKFFHIVDNILNTFKFKSDFLKQRQKDTLEKLLERYIRNEDYIKCADIKKQLSEINI